MEETVDWPLISTHFLDVSSHIDSLGNGSLLSELTSTSELKNETEARTEANDVLKNGILIETGKGLQWLSLTEALTSGVGGLNLSVEDFQNVAAQLLHSQTSVGAGTIENSSTPSVEEEQISLIPNPKLESIAEATEHSEVELFQPVVISNISVSSKNLLTKKIKILTTSESSSLTVSESTGTNSDSSVQSAPPIQVKRKGGWPKGRKRKPELTNRPPKAPCTGYVYYLNEKRKRPEFSNMPFPVVTKVIGNEWSSLSLERKKEYLEKAEMDKKRYREELKVYRNSDTYRSHLKRRRIKNCKTNGTEESDVDATDEIDDEDNEELYCRACDQWFTTLHNKKEHLYGKQHFQTIYQNANSSLSLDESSLDGVPLSSLGSIPNPELPSVPDAMSHLFCNIAEREREINTLQEQLQSSVVRNKLILKELHELKQSQVKLQKLFSRQKDEQCKIERVVGNLWSVSEYFNLQ